MQIGSDDNYYWACYTIKGEVNELHSGMFLSASDQLMHVVCRASTSATARN